MDHIAATGQPAFDIPVAPSRSLLCRLRATKPLWWIVGFAIGVLGWLGYWLYLNQRLDLASFTSILMAVFLGLLPTLICVVQSTTRARQLRKLRSLGARKVTDTSFYRTALTSIEAIDPASVDNDYRVPLITLFFMNCAGFGLLFTAMFVPEYFDQPYVLLMGLNIPDADVRHWQIETFTIVGMAFVGSYIYTLGRLLDRVNNADLYPISLHYYVARPIIACLAAVVLRHTASVFGGSAPYASHAGLMLVAFAMGLAPDLFILALARRAFQWMKVWGARVDPGGKTRPAALPLLMIDDLTREKVDRLNELGIDSAHALAYQNPFLLWPRLPFELGLLVDWIAQAQLFVLVGADRLMALHRLCIMNIFDLALRLEPEAGHDALCHALGIEAVTAPTLLRQIQTDQAYSRLLQVRDAMLPPKTHRDDAAGI